MNGFTKSIDRKIEASKRRQAEEERAKAPNRAPTQGLTDMASTANNNVPMRKPTVTLPDFGAVEHGIRRITEIGIGGGMPGQMVERVIFDPAITVFDGDTIELRSGIVHVKPGEMTLERLQAAGRQACIEAIEATPGRSRVPVDQICTVAEAMDRLKLAMQQDPDYARTWHDNIAMAFVDGMRWTDEALGLAEPDQYALNHTRRAANRAAEHLMEQAFGADTSAHAERVTEPAAETAKEFWMGTSKVRIVDPQRNTVTAAPDDIMAMIQSINADDERRLAAWARNEHPGAFNRIRPPAYTAEQGERDARVLEMLSKPPEAPGGLNEVKVRWLENMGNDPLKIDKSNAAGITYSRRMTLDAIDKLTKP